MPLCVQNRKKKHWTEASTRPCASDKRPRVLALLEESKIKVKTRPHVSETHDQQVCQFCTNTCHGAANGERHAPMPRIHAPMCWQCVKIVLIHDHGAETRQRHGLVSPIHDLCLDHCFVYK